MKQTESLISYFCEGEKSFKHLIGKKCVIKPHIMEEGLKSMCKTHWELCQGELTIVATQLNYRGDVAVRVQNDKIKSLHTDGGVLLNSFIKDLDEIDLIGE